MCNCKEKMPNVRVKFSNGKAYIADCTDCRHYARLANRCNLLQKCICQVAKCPLDLWKITDLTDQSQSRAKNFTKS